MLCAAVGLFADCSVNVNSVFLVDTASHGIGGSCFLKLTHSLSDLAENVLLRLIKLLVASTEVVAPCFLAGAVNLHHVPTVFSGHGAASLL